MVTETVKSQTAGRIMSLFEGFADAYGTYNSMDRNDLKGGKLEIKATARTIRSPVTRELWIEHLEGRASLGIIPVRDNNTCLWGCIDIDTYDLDLSLLVSRIEECRLPLVACRSKSGGAHLFIFMAEPVNAELLQSRLREMAALMGHGSAEVFPKQRSVAVERGDLGNWLNMPYLGGNQTKRYGLKAKGMAMSLEEFLSHAESLQQPAVYLNLPIRPVAKDGSTKGDPDFGDGPPCMQHLSTLGFPEGMRNKGLFALATLAKRKYGQNWTEVVERWNRTLLDPPLPSAEVVSIIRSHETKDYHYTCREHPLSAHCNSTLCRTRKYGVGGDDDYPVISGLSVLETDPPLWFLDVENERLELTTEELQNYRAFHKMCMERVFRCYRMMKQENWIGVVSAAMKDVTKIEAPPEVGVRGHFEELLQDFCNDRYIGRTKEEILLGKPYRNEDEGRHYFRLSDLEAFLERQNFKIYNRAQISTRIRALGGDRHFFNMKNRGVNVWWIPITLQPIQGVGLPVIRQEPI